MAPLRTKSAECIQQSTIPQDFSMFNTNSDIAWSHLTSVKSLVHAFHNLTASTENCRSFVSTAER